MTRCPSAASGSMTPVQLDDPAYAKWTRMMVGFMKSAFGKVIDRAGVVVTAW